MLFGFITGLHVCLREAVRGALKEKRAYSSPTSTPHHQSGLTLDGLMKPGACFGKNLALLFIMINLYLSFCTTSVQSWGKISKSFLLSACWDIWDTVFQARGADRRMDLARLTYLTIQRTPFQHEDLLDPKHANITHARVRVSIMNNNGRDKWVI